MNRKNIINLVCLIGMIMVCVSCNQTAKTSSTKGKENVVKDNSQFSNPVNNASIDKNKISGNWVRTDATYNLKIAELSEDGSMKVEYLNPKSIHVEKATWTEVNGVIQIYVELRDENYPGSNYNLFYIADKDLLAGKYFQAVEGLTYDVGFMRAR